MTEKQSPSINSGMGGKREGAGRKPGVPNKTTAQVKEALGVFISNNVDKLNDWIAEVDDPAKRIDLYFKAMEYAVPKLARTEHVGDATAPVVTVFKFQDD